MNSRAKASSGSNGSKVKNPNFIKTFEREDEVHKGSDANQIFVENLAQAFVEVAVRCGIKYWFVNSGTDWPPFMDAIARMWANGSKWPKIIICPHEFTATSMAHGYVMVSGDVPLVGYHTTAGTYNALGAIANAYTAHVPLFLFAGGGWITRGPDVGPPAQGSRYQAGPLREYIKWDCEIKLKAQISLLIQRALRIARTEPPGPVYISIPNEVALMKAESVDPPSPRLFLPSASPQGDPEAIARAAKILVEAENPLIITGMLGRNPAAVNPLIRFAELLAIPVSGAVGNFGYMNFPPDHPLSILMSQSPPKDVDVFFIIESPRPWFGKCIPNPDAKYINLAINPEYIESHPLTGLCPSEVSIMADPAKALIQLFRRAAKLISKNPPKKMEINERFERIKEMHNIQVENLRKEALSLKNKKPIDRRWINYCIGQIKTEKDILINNYGYRYQGSGIFTPGTYFASPIFGCLGWGLGAALGAKLAAPDYTVIACMGDGSYLYGNPVAAHFTSKKYGLPVLVIIYNDQSWGAPCRLHSEEFRGGWAVKYDYMRILYGLEPSPDFKLICESLGGYAETVEDPSEVQPALERALKVVKVEKRQALLNFILAFGEQN